MDDRRALRPDLSRCELEERILPAIEFGMFPNPFLQVNLSTNQFYVPGTSTSSAGINAGSSINNSGVPSQGLGSNPPGPQWYFIVVGANASGVSSGSIVGGSTSIYSFASLKFLPTGAMVHTISNLIAPGSGGGGGGGGGDSSSSSNTSSTIAGTFAALGGYGATFSSGYNFALGSANNYGMFSSTGATTTLGSVPVHNYSGGGDLMDAPGAQAGADQGNGTNNPSLPVPGGPAGLMPGYGMSPGYGTIGPGAKLYDNLLGKNPGQMGPKAVGPSATMGAAGQGNP